jgi:serine phosphatase RsbU (regulator of sigma subunit)
MLVFYTDGLTEAKRNVLEGERLVFDAIRSDDIASADNPAEALRRAVIPNGSHDDVAILTMTLIEITGESSIRSIQQSAR